MGNSIANQFDANSNLILSVRTELCTISGVSTHETFSAAAYYECLNQVVLQATQGADGNVDLNVMGLAGSVSFWDLAPWNVASSTLISCTARDSRGNPALTIDDPKGNSSSRSSTGTSRATQFQQHLRQAGQGQNPPAPNQTLLPGSSGTIITTLILDGNSRQTQLIDDRDDVQLLGIRHARPRDGDDLPGWFHVAEPVRRGQRRDRRRLRSALNFDIRAVLQNRQWVDCGRVCMTIIPRIPICRAGSSLVSCLAYPVGAYVGFRVAGPVVLVSVLNF